MNIPPEIAALESKNVFVAYYFDKDAKLFMRHHVDTDEHGRYRNTINRTRLRACFCFPYHPYHKEKQMPGCHPARLAAARRRRNNQ